MDQVNLKPPAYVAARTPNGLWAIWDELLGMPLKVNLSERQAYSELSYRLAGGKRAQAEIEQALKEPERWQAWLAEVEHRHDKLAATALERKCSTSAATTKRAWMTRGELIAELQVSATSLKKYVDRGVAPDGRHILSREVLEEERLRGAYHPHIRTVFALMAPPPTLEPSTPPPSKEGAMSTSSTDQAALSWMPMSHLAKELGIAMSTMHHWVSKGETPEGQQIVTREVTQEDNQHPNVKQLVALVFTPSDPAPAQANEQLTPSKEAQELAALREKNAELQAALVKRDEQAQADQDKIQRLTQALDREREASTFLEQQLEALDQELLSTRQVEASKSTRGQGAPWMIELLELLHAHRYALGESDPRVWRLLYEAQMEVKPC